MSSVFLWFSQFENDCICAKFVIMQFRRAGLSADNHRIAVLNTAFASKVSGGS